MSAPVWILAASLVALSSRAVGAERYTHRFSGETVVTVCAWSRGHRVVIATDKATLAWSDAAFDAAPQRLSTGRVNGCAIIDDSLVIAADRGFYAWRAGAREPALLMSGPALQVLPWRSGVVVLVADPTAGDVLRTLPELSGAAVPITSAAGVKSFAIWRDALVYATRDGLMKLVAPDRPAVSLDGSHATALLIGLDADLWIIEPSDVSALTPTGSATLAADATDPPPHVLAAGAWRGMSLVGLPGRRLLVLRPNASAIERIATPGEITAQLAVFGESLLVATTAGLARLDPSARTLEPIPGVTNVTAMAASDQALAIADLDRDGARLWLWDNGAAPREVRHDIPGEEIKAIAAWSSGFVVATDVAVSFVSPALFRDTQLELAPIAPQEAGQPIVVRWTVHGDSPHLVENAQYAVRILRGTEVVSSHDVQPSRLRDELSVQVPSPGVSGSYELELRATFPLATTVVSRTALDLHARGVAPLVAISLGALVLVLTAGLASAKLRRALLIAFGRRWLLITGSCDVAVEVVSDGDHVRISARPATAAVAAFQTLLLPGDDRTADPQRLTSMRAALPPGATVLAAVGEDVFDVSWSRALGAAWSDGARAIVLGQIASIAHPVAARPLRTKQIRLAALACAQSHANPVVLSNVNGEAAGVGRTFVRWGAAVEVVGDATTAAFERALTSADVVHVASHATLSGIQLSNATVSSEHVTEAHLPELRCRLLILSACEVGKIADPARSVVFELVKRGVNIVASTAPLDSVVCNVFFEELYRALLPARRSQGIPIAGAIRAASLACEQRFGTEDPSWKRDLDALTLYGDPSLQFCLR